MEDSQFIRLLISIVSGLILLLVSVIGYFLKTLWKKVDSNEDTLNTLIGEYRGFNKNSKM